MLGKYPRVKVLAVIATLLAGTSANAKAVAGDDVQSAEIVASLIQSGDITVDQKTGQLKLKSSVANVLEQAGVIDHVNPERAQMASNGNSTTGGGC